MHELIVVATVCVDGDGNAENTTVVAINLDFMYASHLMNQGMKAIEAALAEDVHAWGCSISVYIPRMHTAIIEPEVPLSDMDVLSQFLLKVAQTVGFGVAIVTTPITDLRYQPVLVYSPN